MGLACYFCFADVVLIGQCSYYNALNARRRRSRRRLSTSDATAVGGSDPSEEDPLLERSRRARRRRSESLGLPGSHRRHSVRRRESTLDPLTRIITGEDDTPDSAPWLHNTLSLAAVWIVGTAGWFVSYRMGVWEAVDGGGEGAGADDGLAAGQPEKVIGVMLGYFSALCYLWYVSQRGWVGGWMDK